MPLLDCFASVAKRSAAVGYSSPREETREGTVVPVVIAFHVYKGIVDGGGRGTYVFLPNLQPV